MEDIDINDIRRRMGRAVETLKSEFSGLRTGRASANLLDPIRVEAYGSTVPINQVGAVSVPEPRMLSIQIWDQSLSAAVEKAIRNSSLGLNPISEGSVLRIPIPPLNEERRTDLAKTAGTYAENSRVAVRNVRRDGMDKLKTLEKVGDISEDHHKKIATQVQKVTNEHISRIDTLLKVKQDEIVRF